jgi:transcriptional regulator with XRE-family HTH domain
MMTAGRDLLLRTGLTQEGIAHRVDVDRSLVAKWLAGVRKPSALVRKKLEATLRIPVDAWDRPPKREKKAPPPPPPSAVTVTDKPYRVDVRARIKQLDTEIHNLIADKAYKGFERVKMLRAATGIVQILGKMTGDTDITPIMIARSPSWRVIEDALLEALRKHPQARASVAKALEKVFEPAQANVTSRATM